jgi:hypothetical protein
MGTGEQAVADASQGMDRKLRLRRSMGNVATIEDNTMPVPPFAFARLILVGVPSMLVAGCMTASAAQSSDAGAPLAEQTCHAEPAKAFVGKAFNATALRKASGVDNVRRVNPGEAISMLFMNGRLTVYVDEKGVITSLSCS